MQEKILSVLICVCAVRGCTNLRPLSHLLLHLSNSLSFPLSLPRSLSPSLQGYYCFPRLESLHASLLFCRRTM